MTIREVSEKYHISQDTLRYYERAVKTGVLSWEADEPTEENCHVLGND